MTTTTLTRDDPAGRTIVMQPSSVARQEAHLRACAASYTGVFNLELAGFVMDVERHAFFTLKDKDGLFEVRVDADNGAITTQPYTGDMTLAQVVSIITRMGNAQVPIAR